MTDILIVGGGAAGCEAAKECLGRGKRVCLVEAGALGGTCLNRGCIPAKSLLYSAKLRWQAERAADHGLTTGPLDFDLGAAMAFKDEAVRGLRAALEQGLRRQGLELVSGRASCLGCDGEGYYRLRVDPGDGSGTEEVQAPVLIMTTGSENVRPPLPGLGRDGAAEAAHVLDSDAALALAELPARVAILGAGAIGMEFAFLWSSLGVKTRIVEAMPSVLPFMDADCSRVLMRSFPEIEVLCGVRALSWDGRVLALEGGDGKDPQALEADALLVATGRRPLPPPEFMEAGLGEALRPDGKPGFVVDSAMATPIPGLYAAGDATGLSLLAHAAARMGRVAGANACAYLEGSTARERFDPSIVPWAVYGPMESAGIGINQEEAKARGVDYIAKAMPMRSVGRFMAERGAAGQGICKLLAERGSGRLLGACIVSSSASELIWGLEPFLRRGLGLRDLADTVFPHPTEAEALAECARALLEQT